MKTKLQKIQKLIEKTLLLSFGVFLVAIALELFLIPNNIIDGGVVGISIMASYLSKIPLGLFIFFLNIPFLIAGFKKIGKNFIITSFACITLLSVLVSFIHGKSAVTDDVLLACVFGGIILGIGLGIILRNNGSLDGTELIAILLNKQTSFSVGEIIMFINIFILGSAGFVFGWDRAMYSLLAYFIIFKTVDIVIEGLDESKSIIVISDKYEEIARGIMEQFQRGVTYIEGQGAYTGEPKKIIFCVVSRLELANLKSFILDVDESAFIAIENVHEVEGGLRKKEQILKK
jgi:uncharacterized membrane-anchored protein YitT (DUF2179 family)